MLSASSKNTIHDLVKDLHLYIMDSNNSEKDKYNTNTNKVSIDSDNESNRIRNQVKKNIRNIFNNTKDKPVIEKVKILNTYKNSND